MSSKEKYIVTWLYPNGKWGVGYATNTYDEAVNAMNRYKCYDKRYGVQCKYRIIKQIIQEEVVCDEL